MCTKKDFERAAKIVVAIKGEDARREVRNAFITFFMGDNPKFNAERFRAATEVK